jgi:hypothetical protein
LGRAIRITCYVMGAIVIIFGIVTVNEYYMETSDKTGAPAPYISSYSIIGAVLIVIGIIIVYIGFRNRIKTKISLG